MNNLKRNIHLSTILGIPIDLNYSWFIIFFLITWTLAQGYFPNVVPFAPVYVYWTLSAAVALLFFVSLLAHELSHSIVAMNHGLPINGITLFLFGGVAKMDEEPKTPAVEFKMAVAGPLCSMGLSIVFYLIGRIFFLLKFPALIVAASDYLSFINLAVGIFNLIPGFPLDGGRILRAALWNLFGDMKKATRIASSFGKGFAYLLMGLGLLYLFYGVVVSGIWLILIGFFLQEAASSSYIQMELKKCLAGTRVRKIMSENVVTVHENTTLLSLVDDYFFKYRFTSFPVLSDEGAIVGLAVIHVVKDVPRELWPNTMVREVMFPIKNNFVISPSADVCDALTQMAGNGVGRLLVIHDKKLAGIISQRDVMRLFEFREDLGE